MDMKECTVWMYEKDKINKKSGSRHQTFQNVDIFQKIPDCFGSFRNCSVCFGCFDTGSKHRNKRKRKIFGFTKQTETNAKQILFRFVSVRTENFFFSFRGHPSCSKVNWQGWHLCRRSSGEVRWSGHVCGPCPVGRTGRPWPLIWWSWTELHCILFLAMLYPVSYTAPCELRCTPLSCTTFYWAALHTAELNLTVLSYTTPCWATLHPSELPPPPPRAPAWLHHTELCYNLLHYSAPSDQCSTLLSYATSYWATLQAAT
jgi:hypothetical protein